MVNNTFKCLEYEHITIASTDKMYRRVHVQKEKDT